MQWWGALTQQFQHIATSAMKDAARQTAVDATRNLATGLAKDALKTATGRVKAAASPRSAAKKPVAAKKAGKAVAKKAAPRKKTSPRTR